MGVRELVENMMVTDAAGLGACLQGVEEAQEAPAQLRANLGPTARVQEHLQSICHPSAQSSLWKIHLHQSPQKWHATSDLAISATLWETDMTWHTTWVQCLAEKRQECG